MFVFWRILTGVVPVVCGVLLLLTSLRVIPGIDYSSERMKKWRSSYGSKAPFLGVAVIIVGVLRLLRVI